MSNSDPYYAEGFTKQTDYWVDGVRVNSLPVPLEPMTLTADQQIRLGLLQMIQLKSGVKASEIDKLFEYVKTGTWTKKEGA